MGANFSSGNNVAVWCDKPAYYSGDVVQGYVCLNVYAPMAVHSINVEVVGFECTSWTDVTERTEHVPPPKPGHKCHTTHNTCHPHSQPINITGCPAGNMTNININITPTIQPPAYSHPHSHHKPCHEAPKPTVRTIIVREPRYSRNDFFKVNVPLKTWAGSEVLQPGQYQFPFNVALPVNMPGSFRFHDDFCRVGFGHHYEDVNATVEYKVAAVVMQRSSLGLATHLHDSLEVIVRQRLALPPAELVAESMTNVRSCCFKRQGAVMVRVHAAKDAYAAGETAMVLLEVENHTNLHFPFVGLEVERVITLRASGCTYRSDAGIFKHKFPGLEKSTSHVGDDARRLAFPLPASLVPTTIGGLVSCVYRAKVEMSAGLLTNNPRLKVPFTIYSAPPPHEAYATAPPAFWQPQVVMAPVLIQLPTLQPPAPEKGAVPSAPAAGYYSPSAPTNPMYAAAS